MDFLYLLSSVLGESAGNIFDKINFRRNKVGFRQLLLITFLFMSLFLLGFILLTKPTFPELTIVPVSLVVLIGLFSFGGNAFDYLSLKADDISLREPLLDFEPVLAGLIGYVLFPAERKTPILIAFILGALVVRWGIHRRKLRSAQKKGMGYLLMGIVLYAVLPSLYKEAVNYMSPAYIAFFRVVLILLLTAIVFPVKSLRGYTPRRLWYSLLASAACSVAAVTSLYAIRFYGVVVTMLFMMLGPALRYLGGQFILKEKIRRGEVLASLMLTLIVAVAVFIN
jgi:glucose uptake protein GlcU